MHEDETHLHPDIVRHLSALDEPSNEVEVGITGGGVCDLDLLQADLDEGPEEAGFLLYGHRVREGLIPISQVGRQPDWR